MRQHLISNESEIGRIMEYLVDRGADVEVCPQGKSEKYISRLLAIRSFDEVDGKALLLEKLTPETGDGVILQSEEVEVAFWMDTYLCRFHSSYMCMWKDTHPLTHMIDFPSSVKMEERRTGDRVTLPFPEFHSAVFALPQGDGKDQKREFTILDYSKHGLGLLVEKRDFPLLKHLRPGHRIPDMILYGEGLLTRLTGIIRHKTEIMAGAYSGHFLLGIESEMDLEDHFHASDSHASRQGLFQHPVGLE